LASVFSFDTSMIFLSIFTSGYELSAFGLDNFASESQLWSEQEVDAGYEGWLEGGDVEAETLECPC